MPGYPSAELEGVRITSSSPPEVTLVYRVISGPAKGARIRLGALVGSVQYIDLPEEPLEEGKHGHNRSKENDGEETFTEENGGEENDGEEHCECYECEECPHEETYYCETCEPEEEFWE